MGTAQLTFEGCCEGVQPKVTWPEVTCPEVTWPEVTLVTWPKVNSSQAPCPEVCSAHAQPKVVPYPPQLGFLTGSDVSHVTGSRFCACPDFPPRFFLSSSTMATGCDQRSLDTFRGALGFAQRKLCNTRSSSKQCWLGVFSMTFASYNHRKPPRPIISYWN